MEFPPPLVPVDPTRLLQVRVPAGTMLVRVYDPQSRHHPKSRTFRHWGPTARFDHQRGGGGPHLVTPAADDPDRAIYYAAYDLEGAVVEVFGNPPRIITRGTYRAAYLKLSAALTLLDLRHRGGMLAGPSTGISGTETRALSQAWARYFYDRRDIYGDLDGLLYGNSHNYQDALAIFERARWLITASSLRTVALTNSKLEHQLLRIASDNGLTIED